MRDPQQAVQLAARANALTGGKVPVILETLAVAHAAAGDFEEAARIARRGLERARAQGDEKLARELSRRLQSYQAAAN